MFNLLSKILITTLPLKVLSVVPPLLLICPVIFTKSSALSCPFTGDSILSITIKFFGLLNLRAGSPNRLTFRWLESVPYSLFAAKKASPIGEKSLLLNLNKLEVNVLENNLPYTVAMALLEVIIAFAPPCGNFIICSPAEEVL